MDVETKRRKKVTSGEDDDSEEVGNEGYDALPPVVTRASARLACQSGRPRNFPVFRCAPVCAGADHVGIS